MALTGAAVPTRAAIFVERVTIRNFKGIEYLDVDLRPGLSLLVGRNNAGKSRILRALHVAIGLIPVERDDLTVGSKEPAEIDVIVAPRPPKAIPGTAPLNGAEDDLEVEEQTFDSALQGLFGASPCADLRQPGSPALRLAHDDHVNR